MYLVSLSDVFPFHFTVGAITGGAVGGVIAGGLCICLALCICVSVCCCYQKKKAQRRTAASVPTATVQPAAVAIVGQTTAQDGQQSNKPPEYMYNPGYDPTLQGGYTFYPATYTQPSPYPLVPGGTLPPTYPPAGGTLPLPIPLWVVGHCFLHTLLQEALSPQASPLSSHTLLSLQICLHPIQWHLPSLHHSNSITTHERCHQNT